MDGWNCSFFNETRARKRLMAVKSENENDRNSYEQKREPSSYHWDAKGGELIASSQSDSPNAGQSWIYYHRPLQDGETLQYQFYSIPGESVAHPTLGRIAMMLEPSDVVEHWIAKPAWDEPVYGIDANNAFQRPEYRKGPPKLPLKEKDWNLVEIRLKDNVATVKLNGEVVYQTPDGRAIDTRFGFFRYQHQTTRVREIRLTGDWPTEFSVLQPSQLLASARTMHSADRWAIQSILDDQWIQRDIPHVIAQARELVPDEAYAYLKRWVLPSDDHRNVRLYYGFEPYERVSSSDTPTFTPLLSPAIELVHMATKLNRLAELLRDAQAIECQQPLDIRNRSALIALIAMAKNDLPIAREELPSFLAGLKKGDQGSRRSRSVGGICRRLASAGILPADRWGGRSSHVLSESQPSHRRFSGYSEMRTNAGILFGKLASMRAIRNNNLGDSSNSLTQWHRVAYVKPDKRVAGQRPSYWSYQRGSLEHVPSGTWEQLYFQSPFKENLRSSLSALSIITAISRSPMGCMLSI